MRLQSYTLFWKFNTITAKTKRWSELWQAYRLLYNAPTSYDHYLSKEDRNNQQLNLFTNLLTSKCLTKRTSKSGFLQDTAGSCDDKFSLRVQPWVDEWLTYV